MEVFDHNIQNVYGEQGIRWLAQLPSVVEKLSEQWQLRDLIAVNNMTYNYVVKAIQNELPVILKISCGKEHYQDELQALQYFDGHACVKVLAYDDELYALLLEQAIPGNSLKNYYPDQDELAVDICIDVMDQLHLAPRKNYSGFPHISDWLSVLDKVNDPRIPNEILNEAIKLKNYLLEMPIDQVMLHGDLHHDNIIQDKDRWLAIDPKGVIGERAFEVSAFNFNPFSELIKQENVLTLFQKRAKLYAKKLNIPLERIIQWDFVRLMLMACWNVEDNTDPAEAIRLAEQIDLL